MTCEVCIELLATSTTTSSERAAVDAHLATCPTCRGERAFLAQLNHAMTAEPSWAPPTNFASRVGAQGAELLSARMPSVYGVTPPMIHAGTTAIVWLVGLVVGSLGVGPVMQAAASGANARPALAVAVSISMALWLRSRLRLT